MKTEPKIPNEQKTMLHAELHSAQAQDKRPAVAYRVYPVDSGRSRAAKPHVAASCTFVRPISQVKTTNRLSVRARTAPSTGFTDLASNLSLPELERFEAQRSDYQMLSESVRAGQMDVRLSATFSDLRGDVHERVSEPAPFVP